MLKFFCPQPLSEEHDHTSTMPSEIFNEELKKIRKGIANFEKRNSFSTFQPGTRTDDSTNSMHCFLAVRAALFAILLLKAINDIDDKIAACLLSLVIYTPYALYLRHDFNRRDALKNERLLDAPIDPQTVAALTELLENNPLLQGLIDLDEYKLDSSDPILNGQVSSHLNEITSACEAFNKYYNLQGESPTISLEGITDNQKSRDILETLLKNYNTQTCDDTESQLGFSCG